MTKAKAKMGRPSIFTDKMATKICVRLADGESLRAICADEGMPDRNTVRVWTQEKPDFSSRYARARAEGMYALAEDALERAGAATQENAAAARVYVDTVKWFASKMAPAAFGDKAVIDLNATTKSLDEQPVSTLQLARDIAFALTLGMQAQAPPSEPSDPPTTH